MDRNGQETHTVSRGQETVDGAGVGYKQAERLCDGTHEPTPTCVGFSEIDKYATSIYKHHYPEHKNYGDATTIDAAELPDFNLLVGGFPCQAFSIAGKRAGFSDTRGTLFFEVARILKAKKPRLFLLENVRGLLSHDKGRTFQTIIGVLSDIGYRDIQWQVLNSKDVGVPQNRERVLITGHLGARGGYQVFPLREGNSGVDEGREQQRYRLVSNAIDSSYYKGADGKRQLIEIGNISDDQVDSRSSRVYDADGIAVSLASTRGGLGAKTGLYEAEFTDLFSTQTLIRRLTPIECERLQGFPDNWTATGENGEAISDSQRYKCTGNAVTTNVIEAIMTAILRVLSLTGRDRRGKR